MQIFLPELRSLFKKFNNDKATPKKYDNYVEELQKHTPKVTNTTSKIETIHDVNKTDEIIDTEYADFVGSDKETVKLIDIREITKDMKMKLNLVFKDTKQMKIEINEYRTFFKKI